MIVMAEIMGDASLRGITGVLVCFSIPGCQIVDPNQMAGRSKTGFGRIVAS